MSNETKGVVALVAAAIMYGFTGLFIRFLTGIGLNVYSINFLEYLIGIVLIYSFIRKRGENIDLPLAKEWLYLLLVGFCYFGVTITLFYAFNNTTIASAELLHYTFPIITVIGAVLLLKERVDARKVLAVLLSIAGLLFIFGQSLNLSHEMYLGNFCAFLSAFPVTLMTLIGRKLKTRSAYFTTFWGILFACLIYLPFFIANNSITSLQQIGYVFLASVFFIGITTPLYFFGLRHIAASTAGILMLIEILSGIIIGLVFYQEVPQLISLLGGALIVISCMLVLRGYRQTAAIIKPEVNL